MQVVPLLSAQIRECYIDDQGLLAMGEQPAGQPDRIGRDPNPWTEGYRALSLERLRDRPLIEHETAI